MTTTATTITTAPAARGSTPGPLPTPVLDLRAAQVSQLEDALAASEPGLARARSSVDRARADLSRAEGELAALTGAASTLQQQLCAATSTHDRHRIEQLLDQNVRRQGPVEDRRLTAAEELARADRAVTREQALAGKVRGDLARATAELATARAQGAAATVSLAELDATMPSVSLELADLAALRTAARARVGRLLGEPPVVDPQRPPRPLGLLELLQQRVDAARTAVQGRADAVRDAERRVAAATEARSPVDGRVTTTAAALAAADDQVRAAVTRLRQGVFKAAAVLETARGEADLDPPVQASIDVAARTATTTPEDRDRWEVTVPLAVIRTAIDVLDAEHELEQLGSLAGTDLRSRVREAEQEHARALEVQLTTQRALDDAAAQEAVARDEVAAHEATAEQRRLSLVRGDR